MKITLVGECNPYSGDPRFALYPTPSGSSGWRLCYAILGMEKSEYLTRFNRRNLCATKWSAVDARWVARGGHRPRGVVGEVIPPGPKILLGARVARAFDLQFETFSQIQFSTDTIGKHRCLVWPHPSGRSRAWNDPSAIACARDQLRRFTKYVEEFYYGNPDISRIPHDR